MRNRLLSAISMACLSVFLITSCATSEDVASNTRIQKRKYRKGFYIAKKSDKKQDKVAFEDVAKNETTPVVVEPKEEKTVVAREEKVATAQEVAKTTATPQTPVVSEDLASNSTPQKMDRAAKKELRSQVKEAKKANGKSKGKLKEFMNAGVEKVTDFNKTADTNFLKTGLILLLAGLILYIVGAVLAVGSATTGNAGGFGIGALLYILGALCWLAGVIMIIIHFIQKA